MQGEVVRLPLSQWFVKERVVTLLWGAESFWFQDICSYSDSGTYIGKEPGFVGACCIGVFRLPDKYWDICSYTPWVSLEDGLLRYYCLSIYIALLVLG